MCRPAGHDRYGGWSLVVVYSNSAELTRNVTVFDGFQLVTGAGTTITSPVSGFSTPPSGTVGTALGVLAYEGDRGFTGDSLKLGPTLAALTTMTDAQNPPDNFFNSTISRFGTLATAKSPDYVNQLGFDTDVVDASGVLPNGSTDAVMQLTTSGETYFPGVVVVATQLFASDVRTTVAKSVTDLNGGSVLPGDTLEYTVAAVPVSQSAAPTGGCDIAAPTRAGATIAKVVVAADVLRTPGGSRVWRAPTQTPWGRNPTRLLVLRCATDTAGRKWLRVLLPVRPNGAAGWIRADYVLLARSTYSIEIRTQDAEVSIYRASRLIRRFGAVVGAPSTPTPDGLFATYDPVSQPRPGGFIGPWVLHLTGHSDVLDDFGGGPGRVAIHGRGGASLRVPLGSAASHGCIRVDNDVISWLAHTVPSGTPVVIRP